MKQTFIERRFAASSLEVIERANVILEEYAGQNLILTLRQLYYQFVARGFIPNHLKEYKRLGSVINDARLAGQIDWAMMEDRTRELRTIAAWESPQEIMDAVASQYKEDLWTQQRYRPEVWIEKNALIGVIEPACMALRVGHFACVGYVSQSAQYAAGKRFIRYRRDGQTPIVFHLGDHDPSGIDMTRDNADRISMFAGFRIEVRRLALTMDQVSRYNPPPNPAKETDARAEGYIAEYGTQSWELDALEPRVIDRLIRDNINPLIERPLWDAAQAKETRNKSRLQAVSAAWDDVIGFLE